MKGSKIVDSYGRREHGCAMLSKGLPSFDSHENNELLSNKGKLLQTRLSPTFISCSPLESLEEVKTVTKFCSQILGIQPTL